MATGTGAVPSRMAGPTGAIERRPPGTTPEVGPSARRTGPHAVVVTLLVAAAGFAVLAGFALLLGVLVVNFVVGGALGRTDADVARWFAERRTPLRNDLSWVGSHVAETATVVVIVALVLVVLAVRRRWAAFGLLALAMVLEPLVYLVATYFISRNRPAVPRLEHLIVSDSFPSGHTAASVALYGSLAVVVWWETRRWWLRMLAVVIAVVAPVVVATSRMYRGMHNLSDVMCGALIGAGCVVVAYLAVSAGVAAARSRERANADARRDAGPGMGPGIARGVAQGVAQPQAEVTP